MPSNERKPSIPPWAERERASDLAWLQENLPQLWNVALLGFESLGRGAVTVDTTIQPAPDKGHPVWYLTQEQVTTYAGEDEIRMVAQYDPTWELVSILLKQNDRVSSYRIGVPGQRHQPPKGTVNE